MRCPFCEQDHDRVIDTRAKNGGRTIRRKRLCLSCKRNFFTLEEIEEKTISVVKADGRREPYDRKKIFRSIQIACNKRPVSIDQINQIVENVESSMDSFYEIGSGRIGEHVIHALRQLDEVAYVRFASVYRNFQDKDEFLQELNKLKKSEENHEKEFKS
jgi:transcriptional repressor NrdR